MVDHMTASTMEMVADWKKQLMEQGFPLEIEVAKPIKDTSAGILARSLFGSSYQHGREVFEMQVELLALLVKLRVGNTIIPGYRYYAQMVVVVVICASRKNGGGIHVN